MEEYNVSLFVRPKNMKTFYDKILEVATNSISVKDYIENKPIKKISK